MTSSPVTSMEYCRRRICGDNPPNLSELSRLSGVNHWTIRNLRIGRVTQYRADTADLLAQTLRQHFPE